MIFPYRTFKKALYATGTLLSIVAFIVIVTLLVRDETPVVIVTPLPQFVAISVESVTAVPHITTVGLKGRTVDVIARLRNENPRAGTAHYPLTFNVYDPRGNQIASATQSAYLLPGAVQYVIATDIPIPQESQLGRVEVIKPSQSEVTFMSLPNGIDAPKFSSRPLNRTTQTIGDVLVEEQTGIVTNTGTLDWQKVEVVGVAVDGAGNVIAASKTFVGRLLVGEQREFTLQWPQPAVQTDRVIIIPSTNMFREENFVEIIGDPSSLR